MQSTIKLHLVGNLSEGDTEAQIKYLSHYFDLVSPEEADFIYLATFFKLEGAMNLYALHKKPLIVYCWDYYLWNHGTGKWPVYAAFLKRARLVVVPSKAQQLRLKELLGLDSIVIPSGVTPYEEEVSDNNFILDPVRYYPEENERWVEKAASELGIPFIHSEHQYSRADFQKLVASCTFLTCAYREASTGGLSLMEGLYLGKPVLVSNSPYMGAVDYLGDKGYYFQYDDYQDLKEKMKYLWETRPKVKGYRSYVDRFNYGRMAKKLCAAVKNLKRG